MDKDTISKSEWMNDFLVQNENVLITFVLPWESPTMQSHTENMMVHYCSLRNPNIQSNLRFSSSYRPTSELTRRKMGIHNRLSFRTQRPRRVCPSPCQQDSADGFPLFSFRWSPASATLHRPWPVPGSLRRQGSCNLQPSTTGTWPP